ncbi:MAG TPA: hypothetical protein HA257_04430 [Candidatus Methanoperedenaceae archaeon]|nr:hypothetical protein [Candidatus Methanoperedenaceae archaeon]
MLKIGNYEISNENISTFSLLDKIKIAFSLVTVFDLLLLSPKIIKKILTNTVLLKEDNSNEITGFAYDLSSRIPWYYKVGDVINKYGLYGYVYEDGMGSSLKERFFNHFLTYGMLFNKLRVRRYVVISALLFLTTLVMIGFLFNNPLVLFLVIPVIFISPFFTFSYFTWSKPEILAWSLTPVLLYSVVTGSWIPSAILLLALSLMSFTVLFFISFPVSFFMLSGGMSIQMFLLIYAPAVIKITVDLAPFFRNIGIRTFENVLGGRKKEYTSTENTGMRPLEALFLGLYSTLPITLFFTGATLQHIAMATTPAILLLINHTVYRIADPNTFFRIFLVLGSFYAVFHPHYMYLAFFTVVMLIHPNLFEYGLNHSNEVKDGLKEYPLIKPVKLGRESVDTMRDFFSNAAEGSRIVFEGDKNSIKNMGGYSNFGEFVEYLALDRQIEILPNEWIKLYHWDFFVNRLTLLNESNNVETICDVCREAGINYLLCYSVTFVDKLEANGFRKIADLDYHVIQESCVGKMLTPEKNLYLVKCPFDTGIIEPQVSYVKKPNHIEFAAAKGQEYLIKYTYHSAWRAFQSGKKLRIDKFEKNGLSFMKLLSKSDEKVILKFSRPRFPI